MASSRRSKGPRPSPKSVGMRRVSARSSPRSGKAEKSICHFSYVQGGGAVVWSTADEPNLPLVAAKNPNIVRWYQEDQVLDIVFSEPMQLNQGERAVDYRCCFRCRWRGLSCLKTQLG